MHLQIGDIAPAFTLVSDETQEWSLQDNLEQNLVILFFPLAFTGVCTEELCTMRDGLETYAGLNAKIVGISVDSPFTLAEFKKAHQLPFTLLSDFNGDVSRAYGTIYDEFVLGMKNVSKRSAFVVDTKGTIRYAEVLESAGDQPSYEGIQTALNDL